jgi:predicted lipoprotein with Yx(FWY)xxD motif
MPAMIGDRKSDTVRRRGPCRTASFLAVAALGLAAAGCASSPGGSGGPVPTPAATGDLVSAQPTSLGTILVDGTGRTVYNFANDTNGVSTCTDAACTANWPFVPAPAALPASLPGVTSALDSTTRPDGARQLTVAGHPVYTFAGDSLPGQTNGQGQTLNGGVWTVVSPAGAPITNATRAGAPQGSTGGGVY